VPSLRSRGLALVHQGELTLPASGGNTSGRCSVADDDSTRPAPQVNRRPANTVSRKIARHLVRGDGVDSPPLERRLLRMETGSPRAPPRQHHDAGRCGSSQGSAGRRRGSRCGAARSGWSWRAPSRVGQAPSWGPSPGKRRQHARPNNFYRRFSLLTSPAVLTTAGRPVWSYSTSLTNGSGTSRSPSRPHHRQPALPRSPDHPRASGRCRPRHRPTPARPGICPGNGLPSASPPIRASSRRPLARGAGPRERGDASLPSVTRAGDGQA
jgi:hypothetical protein